MLQRILNAAGQSTTFAARTMATHTNRLALEKSPYLLQHKNNPIDWYPWGEEAFDKAKQTNRPIFLSVGYSTCHWCHVMEHESFENEAIAKIMNEKFVSIKVDREERPDIDKVYMAFVVAVTGHGGWPMSVFLTPNLAPITGGTYFPPDDRGGMLGFGTVLNMIADKWKDEKEAIETLGSQILAMIRSQSASAHGDVKPADEVAADVFKHKQKTFDAKRGGFGRAPKFPKPCDLDFLVACAAWSKTNKTQSEACMKMLDVTLDEMSRGGIHDHVGKGFHRYSVDAEWHVPHFEKMLYDQTQLLATYSDFYRLGGRRNSQVATTIRDIADYICECLGHSEGGFYSAEDADSHPTHGAPKKVEGAFCVWEKKEVVDNLQIDLLLTGKKVGQQNLADVFAVYFDVHDDGNVNPAHMADYGDFEDPHGELKQKNVLRRLHSDEECADILGISQKELTDAIDDAKKILWNARKERPPPHLDSKLLTSWQGLAISGFAKAYQAIGDETLLRRAEKCIEFVKKHLVNENGHLLRAVYRSDAGEIGKGPESISAFSDDYAFLIQALLDVYAANGDANLIVWAKKLQEDMISKFWDNENNCGFFISEENGRAAINVRMIEDQDGAEPCANSVACGNLLRLFDVFADERFAEKAKTCFNANAERLNKYAFSLAKMVVANQRQQKGSVMVAIVGSPDSGFVQDVRKLLNEKFIWNLSVVYMKPGEEPISKSETQTAMADGPSPAVYVCQNFTCGLPLRSVDDVRAKLDEL